MRSVGVSVGNVRSPGLNLISGGLVRRGVARPGVVVSGDRGGRGRCDGRRGNRLQIRQRLSYNRHTVGECVGDVQGVFQEAGVGGARDRAIAEHEAERPEHIQLVAHVVATRDFDTILLNQDCGAEGVFLDIESVLRRFVDHLPELLREREAGFWREIVLLGPALEGVHGWREAVRDVEPAIGDDPAVLGEDEVFVEALPAVAEHDVVARGGVPCGVLEHPADGPLGDGEHRREHDAGQVAADRDTPILHAADRRRRVRLLVERDARRGGELPERGQSIELRPERIALGVRLVAGTVEWDHREAVLLVARGGQNDSESERLVGNLGAHSAPPLCGLMLGRHQNQFVNRHGRVLPDNCFGR